jgi:Arc/MetJ family transcription regulator
MDALFSARPGATNEEMHRLTVAAVMHLRDSTAIMNRLANAAARFPRSRTFAPEYQVWRQIPRLRALIDTVHRAMKKDPTLTVGLVNLSSIYGNLDRPDSAIAYAKRALKARVSKDAVGKALESLIGVRMRRAQILGVPEAWTATLPVALAIDSTLSTPASKYFIALTQSQIVADEARLAQYISFGLDGYEIQGYGRPTTNASGQTTVRVMSCERLSELTAMIDDSRARLTAGGEAFAPETVPAIRRGLDVMERLIGQLKPRCT